MTMTPVPSPPAAKRPRLTRAVSGPAAVGGSPAQISLPLSQLSGLPLGKVLTMTGAQAGSNLGAYTLLTSPLPSSDLGPDSSNLTVLSAAMGQEGAAGGFVKVVSPQFQLLTLPAALQGLTSSQTNTVTQSLSEDVPAPEQLQEEGSAEEGPEQATEEREEPQPLNGH